jgi:hypothetical protein
MIYHLIKVIKSKVIYKINVYMKILCFNMINSDQRKIEKFILIKDNFKMARVLLLLLNTSHIMPCSKYMVLLLL